MGPYQVDALFDNGMVRLIIIDENHTSFLVNGHRLKLYHHPASRNAFVKHLSDSFDLMVVGMKDTLTLFKKKIKICIYIYIYILLFLNCLYFVGITKEYG